MRGWVSGGAHLKLSKVAKTWPRGLGSWGKELELNTGAVACDIPGVVLAIVIETPKLASEIKMTY
jgi:hypothetical protein